MRTSKQGKRRAAKRERAKRRAAKRERAKRREAERERVRAHLKTPFRQEDHWIFIYGHLTKWNYVKLNYVT